MFEESSPYDFISSAGSPLCPNMSFTATVSRGKGSSRDKMPETNSPSPPAIRCSSATTTAFVFAADSKIGF